MVARTKREYLSIPRTAHHDRAAVTVEAQHPDLVRAEEPPDLLGNRAEHLGLRNPSRDQRCHAAQCRLLVSKLRERLALLGIRDRRAEKLREVDNTPLGASRQLLGAG